MGILTGTKVYYKLIVLVGTCEKKIRNVQDFRTEMWPVW